MKPLAENKRKVQLSEPATVPPPVGGLNNRDAISAMPPLDAYQLDNWFPGTDNVAARRGYAAHTDALGDPVESLLVYEGAASGVLVAGAGDALFDVTTAGAGASLATGFTSAQWIGVMFANAGSQFLIACNGVDDSQRFDGTTVTANAITGLNSALSYPFAFKGRLYFAGTDELGFYYLGVGNVAGAASYFDLAQIAKKGGKLVAIGSLTNDGGDGPEDYIVFLTSTGEAIVYGGYDPSDTANWSLVGRYFIAKPIGRKCMLEYGDDLLILTQEGIVPFKKIIRERNKSKIDESITSKLGSALRSQIRSWKTTFGWEMCAYFNGNMLIVNVPQSAAYSGAMYQYVMNSETNAWCRFKGMDAVCWASIDSKLYFGTFGGEVFQADTGYDDNGEDILLDARQAPNYFETPYVKHFHFVRLLLEAVGNPSLSVGFSVDYIPDQPNYAGTPDGGAGATWDVSAWDVSEWGYDAETQEFWATLDKEGRVGSIWLRANINGSDLKWLASDYIYQKGKGLI